MGDQIDAEVKVVASDKKTPVLINDEFFLIPPVFVLLLRRVRLSQIGPSELRSKPLSGH